MIESASGDPTFSKTLEVALLADLRGLSTQGVNDSINLAVHGSDGALLAGLTGTTSYGWLRVNMVWVSENHRLKGIGKQLMRQAFDQGLLRGCHSVWLETSNPAARAFYEVIGFKVYAVLANDGLPPAGHTRWFLRSTLKEETA